MVIESIYGNFIRQWGLNQEGMETCLLDGIDIYSSEALNVLQKNKAIETLINSLTEYEKNISIIKPDVEEPDNEQIWNEYKSAQENIKIHHL